MTRYIPSFGCSLLLHAGVVALVVWLVSDRTPDIVVARAPDSAMSVFVVPREDQTFPGLNPVDSSAATKIQAPDDESATIELGGFTFDVGKLAQRALVLFPFVSPGLSLDHFGLAADRQRPLLFQSPASAAAGERTPVKPLALSDAAVQAVIDKAWSRRERWLAFAQVRGLAAHYSADAGVLPTVFRRYTDQNALQPYQDMAIRDPRFWTQLGLAADHVQFIGFIRRYAAANPGTRGTIELLFLLDRIAEASQDALITLLAYNPEADLRWTRSTNRQAYRLALQLLHYYRSELSRRGLNSNGAVGLHYDRTRLAVLSGILRATPGGYRASDARFLMGTILWKQGRHAAALQSWRGLACTPDDTYLAACTQLVRIVPPDTRAPANQADLARQIERVLKNEHGRWWDLSYDRLKRFGYRFDTY